MLERILLVVEAEAEALSVKRMLGVAGFQGDIAWVRSAEAAIFYLLGHGAYQHRADFPLPDVILLDFQIPGVKGSDFLKWLRKQPRLKQIFVVMLTGDSDPKQIGAAYKLGASSFLAKNLQVEEFKNFVSFFQSYDAVSGVLPHPASSGPTVA